jgi:hypothetical protein
MGAGTEAVPVDAERAQGREMIGALSTSVTGGSTIVVG